MKLYMMQGRLSPPVYNHMQEFPYEKWQEEFKLLKQTDIRGVEWLLTKRHFLDNPVVVDATTTQNLPISSLCFDVLVDERIIQKDYLDNTLGKLCEAIRDTKIKNITIPLLENSSMEDKDRREKFIELIVVYADKYNEINFSFEAELDTKSLDEIVFLRDNFFVTYDTGNITSCGLDHASYIKHYENKINNVHLKDRTFKAETVAPLTGDTDFFTIFKCLGEINYDGPFVLQTARGIIGEEYNTILKHKLIFEELYEKHF